MIVEFQPDEIELVRKQWERIVHFNEECFGMKLFVRLLDLHPEYLHLFGFRCPVMAVTPDGTSQMMNQDGPDYHHSDRLQAHGINVVYTLNMLFDNLDDMDMIDELLLKLIRLHLMRGIEREWFDHIVQPFDSVLEYFHRKLKLEDSTALRKAFMFIKQRIQELYDPSVEEILLSDRLSDFSDR